MTNENDWPKVYIIVLNWNGWQDTLECLDSLLKLTYPNFSLVVVDNGSTDGSVEKIKTWLADKRLKDEFVVETKENLGYAGGNNVGLRFALAKGDLDYAWILNNDVVADADSLSEAIKRMRAKPSAGLCGSLVMQYHDRKKIAALGGGFYDKWLGQAIHPGSGKIYSSADTSDYLKYERKINYIEGCAMLVSRQFLDEIGLLSEDYFLYFEEIDWATRARGRYGLAIAPKSLVYHKGGAAIMKKETEDGPRRFSLVFDRYNTRNRLLFTLKFYPYALPVVYLSVLGYALDRLRVGAWANVRIIFGELGNHLMSFGRSA